MEKKTLLTVWVTAVATFAFVAWPLLHTPENINAPGELQEVVYGAGILLLIILSAISLAAVAISVGKNSRKP